MPERRQTRRTRQIESGQVFGRLVVVEEVEPRCTGSGKYGQNKRMVAVRCVCGNERVVQLDALFSGHTTSCGCSRNRARRFPPGEVAKNLLWIAYRKRARRDGYPIDITRAEFLSITQMDCHYCGVPPGNKYKDLRGDGVYVYNGVDRMVGQRGYTKGNVVPCCATCNMAKRDRTYDEFIEWIKLVNARIGDEPPTPPFSK